MDKLVTTSPQVTFVWNGTGSSPFYHTFILVLLKNIHYRMDIGYNAIICDTILTCDPAQSALAMMVQAKNTKQLFNSPPPFHE